MAGLWGVSGASLSRCLVAYLRLADNSRGPLLSRLRGLSPPVVRSRNGLSAPVCPPLFRLVNPPILLVDRPSPRRWTILCLVHPLPHLGLRPRRHPVEQHFFE